MPDACTLLHPTASSTPIIVCSGHSGRIYEDSFLALTTLPLPLLRQSEDAFVDELMMFCPSLGCPLLTANFPRIYCDPNREKWELDPTMFSDPLPEGCNTLSPRVQNGIGTLHRTAMGKHPLYARKLPLQEAFFRLQTCWQPYHTALEELIEHTLNQHGLCIVLDMHSMPDWNGIDFVLGTAFDTSCHPSLVMEAEAFLRQNGYTSRRNAPYAGGFTTTHYGKPHKNIHVIQVEINRTLYMNPITVEATRGFSLLQPLLKKFILHFAEYVQQAFSYTPQLF